MVDTPVSKGDRGHLRNIYWTWYDDLEMMSVREQASIIEYPDLVNNALESPEIFKRLISSEGLLKDLKIALI